MFLFFLIFDDCTSNSLILSLLELVEMIVLSDVLMLVAFLRSINWQRLQRMFMTILKLPWVVLVEDLPRISEQIKAPRRDPCWAKQCYVLIIFNCLLICFKPFWLTAFFCSNSLPRGNRFNKHFQASVHFPLTDVVDESKKH